MPERTAVLKPPKSVRDIAATLEAAGFETWCVGGAVRDALLGRTHLDWDLATAATPDEVRKLFRRTVPLGLEFGTVGVLDRAGAMHEVTTFRRDVKTDGRHAVVEFGVALDEDLARRDFTINAIAYSPRMGVLHDPFDGRGDLQRGIVRAVGDPDTRMREDRLRALRAIRFAARFGFEIEAATWKAIVDSAPFLTRLSRERVRQELEKTMDQVRRPSSALSLWRASRAMSVLLPELAAVPDVTLRAADFIGLPDATAREELASARRRNRLTTLCLDLEPARARQLLRSLRFSNRDVDWMAHMVACWHRLHDDMRAALTGGAPVPDARIRRWVATTGRTALRDFVRVAQARWLADRAFARPVPDLRRTCAVHRRALRVAYRDPVALADLAIDGEDLRDLGIPAGPRVGEVLRGLLNAVIEDPTLNTRDALLALARRLPAPRPVPPTPGDA